MKFINMGRRSGKTTILITTAYATGYPIIVRTSEQAQWVRDRAKSLGMDVEVFSYSQWINIHRGPDNKVLVDEATDFIEDALKNSLNANVVTCTFTIPMEDIKKDECKASTTVDLLNNEYSKYVSQGGQYNKFEWLVRFYDVTAKKNS